MKKLNQIDVDKAIDIVEKINNIEIPWEIKYWVSKTIKTRFNDMQEIYINNKRNKTL